MLKLDPVALTHVGRRRAHNEDYLGDLLFKSGRKYGPDKLNERGYLFAVADGMGGHASGEVASEMAVTTLFERYYNGQTSGDPGTDLLTAVKEANFEVHHAGMSNGRGQMGTTLTLALIKGNRAIVGNVGDSRTYLIRQGLPERVTHDHSLVQDQIDMGALTPEQAERSMIRNVITRAIGHRDEVEPDFFERELEPHDVLLLCSDGLHGAVREEELGIIVASATNLSEAAQQLVDLANERGGVDNISVMLIGISELGDPIPPILNGRAAFYPPPRQYAPTITEPITDRINKASVLQAQASAETTSPSIMLDHSNDPTAPNAIPTPALSVVEPQSQPLPAAPGLGPSPEKPVKKRRGGLIVGLLVLLLIIAAIVAVIMTGALTGQTTIVTPSATALVSTATPADATTPLATVTPSAANPAPPGSAVAIASGGGAGTTPRVTFSADQIKKIQVNLAGFPLTSDKYNVVMTPSGPNPGADVVLKPVGGKFETDGSLSLINYIIKIEQSGGPAVTVPLNLSPTEASSSRPGVKLTLDNATLLVEVTPA